MIHSTFAELAAAEWAATYEAASNKRRFPIGRLFKPVLNSSSDRYRDVYRIFILAIDIRIRARAMNDVIYNYDAATWLRHKVE